MRLAIGGLIVAAAACGATAARGCECGWISVDGAGHPIFSATPPPLTAGGEIDEALVFLGEVLAIDEVTGPERTAPLVTFRVERVWKGRPEATVEVFGGYGVDCGFPFEELGRYVVFARKLSAAERAELGVHRGAAVAEVCSRTTLAKRASDLVKHLDSFRRGWSPH